MHKNALSLQNRAANWFFTFFVRYFYLANVTDVLSGYFAWERKAIEKLRPHISADGFAIEMEMITKMVKMGLSIYSVPITYDERIGNSKITAIRDGLHIFTMLVNNINWSPKRTKVKKHHPSSEKKSLSVST